MAAVLAVVFMTQKIIFVTVAASTAVAAAAVIDQTNQIRPSQDELDENVPRATTHQSEHSFTAKVNSNSYELIAQQMRNLCQWTPEISSFGVRSYNYAIENVHIEKLLKRNEM